jgi:hypothetical protein
MNRKLERVLKFLERVLKTRKFKKVQVLFLRKEEEKEKR